MAKRKKEESKRAEIEWAKVRLGLFEYFEETLSPEQWYLLEDYLTKLDPIVQRCAMKVLFGFPLSHREQSYLERIHNDLREIERG